MQSTELKWRCPKRLKGQRYDKRLLPMLLAEKAPGLGSVDQAFCVESEANVLSGEYTLKHLGVFDGFDGYGLPEKYDAIEVEVSGWVVPAYRKHDPSRDYVICQMYSRKAVKL